MMKRRRSWMVIAGLAAVCGWPSAPRAQEAVEDREYEIKAAYLYNFGLYVQWPKAAAGGDKDHFIIGVFGDESVEPYLNKIAAAKTIGDRKIRVVRFAAAGDYKACHILFVPRGGGKEGESAEKRLSAAAAKVGDTAVLIVTEGDGLAQKGAVINFFIEENRVRFEVNPEAAKRAGLQVSSKLLRLGKLVQGGDK